MNSTPVSGSLRSRVILSTIHQQVRYAPSSIRRGKRGVNTIVPISTEVSTGMLGVVKIWGDINVTDAVWDVHYLTVTDPVGTVAALDV